jgi:predicted NBD/HSP70 family sugar kinase
MTSHSAEERLLDLLSHSAGLTRAQLSRRLSLSKATVSGLVADLLARDVLNEARADGSGGVGRPGTVVRLVGPNRAFALFQWSGNRLRATLADFAGRTLADRVLTVPPEQTLEQLVAGVATELTGLHRMANRDPHLTVGLVAALPTPFQPGVGIPPPGRSARAASPEESPMWAHAGWLSTDPVPALGARLGIPVHAENDANLAALGEVAAGAGRGQDTVAFIKLTATTIGMGLVLSGRIHRGASGFAGELAHIQVDPSGPLCHCGGRGCLRGLLGGALLDAVRPAYDRALEFEDVLELAGAGEPGPRRILDDLGRTLGRALADFCTLLNPSAIVIDGGLGEAGQVVVRAVEESIDRHSAPHAALAVRVLGGTLGADAELAGARALLAATAQLPAL